MLLNNMAKYLVIIDASEAMRGEYIDKVKKKVTADSSIMAAVKVLKKGFFNNYSIKDIKSIRFIIHPNA